MAFGPENSAIRITPEIERQLQTASPEEIKDIMRTAMIDQGLAVEDAFNPTVLHETELAHAAPKRFAQVVTVDGQKHVFEGDSELDVQKQVNGLLRESLRPQEPIPARQEPIEQRRDPDTGRFTQAPTAQEKALLDQQFRFGQITTAEYIERSGAVSDFLNNAGVPVEALQDAVAERQIAQTTQDWATATEAFKARHPEWVGGQQNTETIARILQDNNLIDAEDKLDAMEAAYTAARDNGLLVANPEVEMLDKINSARSADELWQNLGIHDRQRSAEYWRR